MIDWQWHCGGTYHHKWHSFESVICNRKHIDWMSKPPFQNFRFVYVQSCKLDHKVKKSSACGGISIDAGFRLFLAIWKEISILIPTFIKATLFFLNHEWGSENISHFSLSVPKRSNFGHHLQLTIAFANATI